MTRPRLRTVPVLLAVILLVPAVAGGGTITLRSAQPARTEAAPEHRARSFPHLLRIGGTGTAAELERAGNARVDPVTILPSVLRTGPRRLSAWGVDPASALENLRKMQQQAEPETVRILAIRVDFLEDSAGDASTGDGRFDLRPAEEAEIPIDPPPHDKAYFESHFEALRRYYDVQSRGGLVLEYDVFPADPDSAYRLSDTARYGPWIFSVSSDSILARAERFVRESVMLADSLDATIDWKRYDSFVVLHAGTDFQGDVRRDTNYDIPSFNLFLADSAEVWVGGADSVAVNLVMVVPETVSQDDFLGALNGVMAHEFGHQLGFFDLYDVYTGLPAVGVFSLMDSGDGQFGTIGNPYQDDEEIAVRGLLPASIDPWHKLLFFPATTVLREVADGEEITLEAVNIGNEVLYLPVHLSEYFLAEVRPIDYNGDNTVILRADPETGVVLGPEPAEENPADTLATLEYDYLLPGGGLLLWHVDELAAVEGLTAVGGVNVFADRRGLDLEEADGIQDIGTASPEFLGGPFDPYFAGGFSLFGPETVPDSRTNDRTETGISLEVLDPAGIEMRVAIGTPMTLAGWPFALLGAPVPEGLNRADLTGDGLNEIVLAAGTAILGITAEGKGYAEDGERYALAVLPDTLEDGPVVAPGGGGFPTSGGPVVAVRLAGRAFWFDAAGNSLAEWPAEPGEGWVSAGPIPVVEDSLWVVGTAAGRVLGLKPGGAGGLEERFTITVASGDSVVALAAGRVAPEAPLWVAYGGSEGTVGLEMPFALPSPPELKNEWRSGSGPVRSLLAFRAPLRAGEEASDLLLVAMEDRRIDLRRIDGAVIPGWPVALPDTLAGRPALGDPDGDGLLEVVVTTRAGEVYRWALAGMSEPYWPQSLWHPDQTRRVACTTGPRLWDLAGDGTVEIVQLRGDGIVLVLDGGGEPLDGWPYATGTLASEGPLRLLAADGGERWTVAGALSDSTTSLSARPLRRDELVVEDGPGCYPAPGAGPGRAGIYPVSLVPVPLEAETFFDPAALILHPNPVRGRLLRIRYILGESARIVGQLFDVSGRQQAEMEWEGHAGAAGETVAWDLTGVASGTYVVRLRFEGASERRSVIRSIAVVR